jgi:hypothetical protein
MTLCAFRWQPPLISQTRIIIDITARIWIGLRPVSSERRGGLRRPRRIGLAAHRNVCHAQDTERGNNRHKLALGTLSAMLHVRPTHGSSDPLPKIIADPSGTIDRPPACPCINLSHTAPKREQTTCPIHASRFASFLKHLIQKVFANGIRRERIGCPSTCR